MGLSGIAQSTDSLGPNLCLNYFQALVFYTFVLFIFVLSSIIGSLILFFFSKISFKLLFFNLG